MLEQLKHNTRTLHRDRQKTTWRRHAEMHKQGLSTGRGKKDYTHTTILCYIMLNGDQPHCNANMDTLCYIYGSGPPLSYGYYAACAAWEWARLASEKHYLSRRQ